MFQGDEDLQLPNHQHHLAQAAKPFKEVVNRTQVNVVVSRRTVKVQKSAWLGIREASSFSNTEAGTLHF